MGKALADAVPRGARRLRGGGRRARREALARCASRGPSRSCSAHRATPSRPSSPSRSPRTRPGRQAAAPARGVRRRALARRVLGAGGRGRAVARRRGPVGARARHLHAGGGAARGWGPWPRCSGSPAEDVARICAEAADGEVVSPANFNSPEQTVIAGHAAAVERASNLLTRGRRQAGDAPARLRALPLRADGAGEAAAGRGARAGRAVRPARPGGHQRRGHRRTRTPARIVPLLLAQVSAPVRWVESVRCARRGGRHPGGGARPGQGARRTGEAHLEGASRCSTSRTRRAWRRRSARPAAAETDRGATMDFTGKVVLVTGGSRGIGRACAVAFGKAGATVVLTYAGNEAAAAEAVAASGPTARSIEVRRRGHRGLRGGGGRGGEGGGTARRAGEQRRRRHRRAGGAGQGRGLGPDAGHQPQGRLRALSRCGAADDEAAPGRS